jgi:hypothetical protein
MQPISPNDATMGSFEVYPEHAGEAESYPEQGLYLLGLLARKRNSSLVRKGPCRAGPCLP